MRLSFEVSAPTQDGGVEIEVWLDRTGRDYLVRELSKLSDTGDHFHLFSRAWFFSGNQLTEERRNVGSSVGRHVKVYLRPEGETPSGASNSN